jgi:hypothetical protein
MNSTAGKAVLMTTLYGKTCGGEPAVEGRYGKILSLDISNLHIPIYDVGYDESKA